MVQDTTWTNTVNTITLGAIQVNGTGIIVRANQVAITLPMVLNRYGIVSDSSCAACIFDRNVFSGSFTAGNYRLNSTTAAHLVGYTGESLSVTGSTYSVEGGLCTFAQLPPGASNGSTIGCSDCNATCTAGSSNGHACERVSAAWTN